MRQNVAGAVSVDAAFGEPLGKNPEGILIAPDGAHAYVAVNGDNFVSVVDLKTLAETARIQTGTGPDGMAWASR